MAPAPLVTAQADVLRDLFENRCQFHHFQNDLPGLIILDNKSLANITRGVRDSADQTKLSRFFSEAPWVQERRNDCRVESMLQQTKKVRGPRADALLLRDETLCEHVGRLCDSVDRHAAHGDGPYPLAQNLVTSPEVRGPVRLPGDLRLSRRDEECTRGAECVHTHFPDRPIPTTSQDRARLPKAGDPRLVADPDLPKLPPQVQTTIALGMA